MRVTALDRGLGQQPWTALWRALTESLGYARLGYARHTSSDLITEGPTCRLKLQHLTESLRDDHMAGGFGRAHGLGPLSS